MEQSRRSDCLRLDAAERAELGRWIEFYRCERDWLLDGHAYRLDHPDESIVASLFLARDGGHALVTVAKLAQPPEAVAVLSAALKGDRVAAVRGLAAVRLGHEQVRGERVRLPLLTAPGLGDRTAALGPLPVAVQYVVADPVGDR